MEECIICFEETTDFSFYRCTHKVCTTCYPKLRSCPICKTPREMEIIIIPPSNNIRVEYVITSYDIIKNVGCFLFLSSICILSFRMFFYSN